MENLTTEEKVQAQVTKMRDKARQFELRALQQSAQLNGAAASLREEAQALENLLKPAPEAPEKEPKMKVEKKK